MAGRKIKKTLFDKFKRNEKGKVEMTYEEYDDMLELFDMVDIITVYPTMEQIDMMRKNPERWIIPCCYLYEKGKSPKTNDEKYARKNLWNFINEIIEFVD